MPEKTLKEKVECPFCREKRSYMLNVIADGNGPSYMWCSNCLSAGPEAQSAEEALEKWNNRPALTALEEKVAEVESENRSLDFWKDIVLKKNVLDIEQVKRELHDYHMILENVSKVYMHVTGGKVSKENTLAGVVCELADEHYEELYQEEAPDNGK